MRVMLRRVESEHSLPRGTEETPRVATLIPPPFFVVLIVTPHVPSWCPFTPLACRPFLARCQELGAWDSEQDTGAADH